MPASIAASMTAKLLDSSTVYPKFMVPRPILLTSKPERPRCAYGIPRSCREHTYSLLEHGSAAMTVDVRAGLFGEELDDVAYRLDRLVVQRGRDLGLLET
jgi:hypothetical protein